MERTDIPNEGPQVTKSRTNNFSNRTIIGILFLAAGAAWLLERMGVDIIPHWFFSWPMILIALGLLNGIKHSFRNPGAYIMLMIGGAFLIRNNFDVPYELQLYFWPVLVMVVGAVLIFRKPGDRKKKWNSRKNREDGTLGEFTVAGGSEGTTDSSYLDTVSIFGGSKREVISKDFRGGDIVNIFGGTDINFSKADLTENATIDVSILFGGVKLIVPPHWDVQVNTTNIAGGVDDKRRKDYPPTMSPKTLSITGAVVFGGLDIRSL